MQDLLLGIYSFKIKPKRKSDHHVIQIDKFLNDAYPSVSNKFMQGFCADIKNMTTAVIKNNEGNVGAIFTKEAVNQAKRYYDILLDGGNTGVEQFIIDETTGKRTKAGKDKIIGPQFFARFYLPSGTDTAFVFIQSYANMTIKGIYDTIVNELLDKYEFRMVPGRLQQTTTSKRYQQFINSSESVAVSMIKKVGHSNTNALQANTVKINLEGISLPKGLTEAQIIDNIIKTLNTVNIKVTNRTGFTYNTKLKNQGDKSQRTASLGYRKQDLNFVPRIIMDTKCIDTNTNFPIFKQVQEFIDDEIGILRKENKI